MGTPSIGFEGRLYVGATTLTEAYPFVSESLTETVAMTEDRGISGRPTKRSERIVVATKDIAGDIVLEPTPAELDVWLPRILGGTKTLNIVKLATTIPTFNVLINKGGDLHQFNTCAVNTATFRFTVGEPVQLTLNVLGKTKTLPEAEPDVAITDNPPYVCHEAVLRIGGTIRETNEVTLTVNRNLQGLRRFSQTLTHVQEGPIAITFSPVLPFTADEVALLALEATGATGQIVVTKGGNSCTFDLANVKFTGAGPTVGSRDGEILYNPTGTAFSTTSETNADNALVVTSILA